MINETHNNIELLVDDTRLGLDCLSGTCPEKKMAQLFKTYLPFFFLLFQLLLYHTNIYLLTLSKKKSTTKKWLYNGLFLTDPNGVFLIKLLRYS
jgi:hypothetical protein